MDKQHIRIHLKAYDHKVLDVSTVEIVKAKASIITNKDNSFVCSLSSNKKKPRSGLIDGSIEKATIPAKPIKKTIGTIIKKDIIKLFLNV